MLNQEPFDIIIGLNWKVKNAAGYAQMTRIYADRITGSDRHYCIVNDNINAGAEEGP